MASDELEHIRAEVGHGTRRELEEVERGGWMRREAMLKAWAAGYSFAEIADRFEFSSPAVARQAIEYSLASADVVMDRDAERSRFAKSLLSHHRTAMEKTQESESAEEQIAWMKMDVVVIDRISKLLGLDAPTQVIVTPGVAEFERMVSAVAQNAGEEIVVEADPMAHDS